MPSIFRTRPGSAAISWFHRLPRLSNQYCLYCAQFVGEGSAVSSNQEHLIARRLVPDGSFGDPKAFNFIFRACVSCNTEKAGLEDHVSAVTLLTSPGRGQRPDVDAMARRKAARSFDRAHRRPVGEVENATVVRLGDSGVSATLSMVSGAQLDPAAVRLLATRQIQGLLALTTSSNPLEAATTRLLPPELVVVFGMYPHQDWGNPQLLAVSRNARSIPGIADIVTAHGYFRCALRRPPTSGSPWFWALEWNKSVRIVGWIGDRESPPPEFENLPALEWMDLGNQDGAPTRMRAEVPLSERDDILFDSK